jgi:hypothetical protein
MRDVWTPVRVVVCVVAIALASPAALAAQPKRTGVGPLIVQKGPRTDRGIVQSVSTGAIVLKVLDGTVLAIPVNKKTRVLLNGKRASILDVEPGFVAVVTYEGGKRGTKTPAAREVQAFSAPSQPHPASFDGGRGTVQSVSPSGLVLGAPDGGTLRIRIDKKTRVLLNGKRASILDVEPGFVAVVTYKKVRPKQPGGGVAQTVWAFAPQGGGTARPDQGVVQSLAAGAIVLDVGGGTLRIELDARTRVFVNGKARTIREVEQGFAAVVRRLPGGPAREVWAFGPTGR